MRLSPTKLAVGFAGIPILAIVLYFRFMASLEVSNQQNRASPEKQMAQTLETSSPLAANSLRLIEHKISPEEHLEEYAAKQQQGLARLADRAQSGPPRQPQEAARLVLNQREPAYRMVFQNLGIDAETQTKVLTIIKEHLTARYEESYRFTRDAAGEAGPKPTFSELHAVYKKNRTNQEVNEAITALKLSELVGEKASKLILEVEKQKERTKSSSQLVD